MSNRALLFPENRKFREARPHAFELCNRNLDESRALVSNLEGLLASSFDRCGLIEQQIPSEQVVGAFNPVAVLLVCVLPIDRDATDDLRAIQIDGPPVIHGAV